MNHPEGASARFQRHHLIAAIIAILVAVAMGLNYYLW